MPSVGVKLYSLLFKFILKNRLQKIQNAPCDPDHFGVSTRPEELVAPPNPSFTDGVATKDIHIDSCTSLSVRIFLPDSALHPPDPTVSSLTHFKYDPNSTRPQSNGNPSHESLKSLRRKNFNPSTNPQQSHNERRYSSDATLGTSYKGYLPDVKHSKRLPVMLQFHGGGWVSGSNESASNDLFCRRIAKLCDVVILAVGYRLAPDNKFPAAFDDGVKVLQWLAKQMNLAECGTSMHRKRETRGHIVDGFGASTVEPWLAGHVDPTRCVLLGGSCGANIADFVARKAVEMGKRLDPVKIVAQVLMCPFFIGSVPTRSEIKLANSYFYDKATCLLAWKLFLPEEEYSLDHPAGNPLVGDRGMHLRVMPPTLTVVAEYDWMRDRAIAYSEELRKVKVDAPVLEYKDAVHEFATLDVLLRTPQAQACAEDISIWVKKYISLRGHEFSY